MGHSKPPFGSMSAAGKHFQLFVQVTVVLFFASFSVPNLPNPSLLKPLNGKQMHSLPRLFCYQFVVYYRCEHNCHPV
jgi:hypothetical protein